MIRRATKFDKPIIKELLRRFRDSSGYAELEHIDDSPHIDALLDTILAGAGVVFLADDFGMIAALIQPSIWCNKTMVMHELAWFVTPEHRGSTAGYRLLMQYIAYGNQLKAAGRIKYFTLSKLDTSSEMDYTKQGFRKKDENWIQ